MYRDQTGESPTRSQFKAFVKLLKDRGLFNRPLYEQKTHQISQS